jgi:flagellar hook-associated protein 3 FlgL
VSVQVRITHNMMSTSMLADIQRSNIAMARTSNQISSGRRIDSAADDPVGATRSLGLKSSLSANDGYKAAAEAASGWTETTEGALNSIVDIVQGTRELIVAAGNDTLQTSDRQKLAAKLTEMLAQVKATANARYGDQYVLSGQRSDIPPYSAGASDAYGGDTGAVIRTIGPNQQVQVNVTGDTVLGGTAGDGKLLDTMRTAIANLNSATPADLVNLRGPVLTQLSSNLDQILTARAQVASAAVRAELAAERIDEIKVTTTDQLSQVLDTDYAEAITRYSSQKTVYQAALQAGAQVIQPSLMDFLR